MLSGELKRCGKHLGRAVATMCNITDVGRLLIRHTGVFDSQAFAAAFRAELDLRLFPSFIDIPEPQPLDAADLIRGAAAAALFARLRDTGVAGLVAPTRTRVAIGA